jgi:cerevisin
MHATLCLLATALCSSSVIQDRYIVVLKDGTLKLTTGIISTSQDFPLLSSLNMTEAWGNNPNYTLYNSFSHFNGYAAQMPEELANAMAENDDVKYIEQDRVVSLNIPASEPTLRRRSSFFRVQQKAPSWGLTRIVLTHKIDQQATDGYAAAGSQGEGVDVFVIDSGVKTDIGDLIANSFFSKSFVEGEADDIGHGTGVAGIIGGKTFGVAKKATIFSVKVAKNGDAKVSDLVAAMNYVADQVEQRRGGSQAIKSVINLSMGGAGISKALDNAIRSVIASGVVFVGAAGNSAKDTCGTSPGGVSEALIVGATGIDDSVASFSNFGPCVDIWAPGVDITTAALDGTSKVWSGTSFSAPHVTGVVALALSEGTFTSVASVNQYIKAVAAKDVGKNDLT